VRGRVLIIAGSDSGGGAGIQADIKTVTALGGFAMTAITALTAQDTTGVHAILPIPPEFIVRQIEVVARDLGVDSVKLGMLHDAAVIDAVSDALERELPGIPVVVDPVMVAKGGHRLLEENAVATLKRRLAILATVMTPNLPEAEDLAGMAIPTESEMEHAANAMLTLGARAVLLKGGHLPGPTVYDLLATEDGLEVFQDPRIDSTSTHGTGCTLASGIATGLAQGLDLRTAVLRARAFVRAAILAAPGYGHGHGPMDHGVTIDPARLRALG